MQPSIPLRQVAIGQSCRVVGVNAEGELGRRLRDMGLTPGAELSVVGRAPLRDPVALRLKGFTLTLRNGEAGHVRVTPLSPSTPTDPEARAETI